MLKLELRPQPSKLWTYFAPFVAFVITALLGFGMFAFLGSDPIKALEIFLVTPFSSFYQIGEVMVKATPLLIIGLGLSLCYRTNVWNIGAEGQYLVGAIFSSFFALYGVPAQSSAWVIVPMVLVAGVLGGMFWSGIVAFLRTKFNANEILVSLMLVYVAYFLLGYLVFGPWKDPLGYNFPQTKTFEKVTQIPRIFSNSRMHYGFIIALVLSFCLWVLLNKFKLGFALQVVGRAPLAARFAGFSQNRGIWFVLLFSGACAGLAGGIEVTSLLGQLNPYISSGYGFAAIIVAFVGRLHPFGVILSALLLSVYYIGGELAQSRLGLPKAITYVFQGILLFTLLICDSFIRYKLTWLRKK
ncbi:MAG: ABC transporter permease [Gammaproteobacteria bacterium]|nr:ABC transporter permease [Gammaproteobacteria bacterium]